MSGVDLKTIARARSGTLTETPLPVLLRAFADAGRTVVVRVSRGPLEKAIFFERGDLVDCESNLLHEQLGPTLVAQGKLSADNAQKALAWAAAHDRSLADTLVASKALSSFELFKVMQAGLARRLLDVFAWQDGAFTVLGEAPEVESPLKVNVAQLIVTGVLRFTPQAHVDAHVGALVGRPLAVHPAPPTSPEALRLSTRHARALHALKGPLRLDEWMAAGALPPDELTRLAWALSILGIVVPADALPKVAPRPAPSPSSTPPPTPPPAATSISPPSPASSAPSAATAAEIEQVMGLSMRLRRLDAFDALGVGLDASVADVTTAYLALAEQCAPWRFAGHEQVAEKATEVFLALARAYAELVDGDARQRLRERRQQARATPVRPRADVYAIKTELLDADGQFRAGIAHKEAGRYGQAIPLLEYAADLDAQNATYRAELAHCRFLDAPEVQGRRALEAIAEAIRLDPRCAVAHLYSGAIHLAGGDVVKARAALGEAARLAPADPRVRAALQQLGPV